MAQAKQQAAEAAQAVAEVKQTAMVAVTDMEADAGGGFEDANKDAYAIPFIQILQKGSPAIDPDHPKHKEIPGAKIGALINAVTEEVVEGERGLLVLPCHYRQAFIEWAPRDSGGGFVAEHSVADGAALMKTTTRDEKNRDVLPSGNYLVDTRNHYVLVLREDGTAYPAVVSMASTQTKKSRKWMSTMQDAKVRRPDGTMFTPAMWARAYRVRTVGESNAKGTWRGWDISREGDCPSAELYAAARAFRDAVRAGAVKTAEPREPGADDDDISGF